MRLLTPFERNTEIQKEEERASLELNKRSDNILKLRKEEEDIKSRLANFQKDEYEKFQKLKNEREIELQSLSNSVASKKKEMDALLQPLGKQFARFVRDEKKKIQEEHFKNKEEQMRLEGVEYSLSNREKNAQKQQFIAKENEVRALKMVVEAKKYAEKLKREMDSQHNGIMSMYKETEKARNDIIDIKNSNSAQQKELEVKKLELEQKEKELDDRELQIVIKELQLYSPIQ